MARALTAIFAFVVQVAATGVVNANECERLVGSVFTVAELDELFVRSSTARDASFVHVTGARQFSLSLVQRSLALKGVRLKHRRVLSVGEGWSPLTAFVRGRGAEVIGTDCWYGSTSFPLTSTGRELSAFVDANRGHLVGARCTILPFADAAFDLILSNFLIHHLRFEAGVMFLEEVARLLRPGGEAIVTQPTFDLDADREQLEHQLSYALPSADVTWTIEVEAMPILNLHINESPDVDVLRLKLKRPRTRP